MKNLYVILILVAQLILPLQFDAKAEKAKAKKKYELAWSHYTGWEPWAFAEKSGILKKWADKFGIEINITLVNDYVESINLYTSGKYDGCVMTNMDALTIPAVGGVDSTALIVGDFSNGNDGIVAKGAKDIKSLKGRDVKLVEFSVSHYLLTRALENNGLKERDLKLINTSDADIGSIFLTDKAGVAVTWNPILMKVRNGKDVNLLFDSSKIPGEIIDMMVVKTNSSEAFKKAVAGAWFETMKVMSGVGKDSKEALEYMAESAGGTLAEFKAQLKTTKMFYNPKDAADFTAGKDVKSTMEYVRTFSFDHGLFGDGAEDKNFVGISFPDGSVMGDQKNVKLRFADKYMREAAVASKVMEVASNSIAK